MTSSCNNVTKIKDSTEAGLEQIQLIFFLAIVLILGVLFVPTQVKKDHVEGDIRMKALLRAFHSANDAYRQRNPDQGYAEQIAELVHNKKKIHYLEDAWLKPKIEGFLIVYQSPELFPRQSFSLSAKKDSLLKSSFCIDQKGFFRADYVAGASEPLTADDAGCHGGIEVV